jgi:hypothetical protein
MQGLRRVHGEDAHAQADPALQAAVEKQAPPRHGIFRPKLRYAHQGGNNPPVIVIHGNALDHVPDSYRRYLERTFMEAFKLKGTPLREAGGVLFSSNPRGNNEESINGERYGAYYDLAAWREYLIAAGFSELEHYYRPSGLPFEQQPWLASVWRRVG